MNFNFAAGVREALEKARDHAVRLGHDYVGTEHILFGLLDNRQPVEFLQGLGAPAERLRTVLEQSVRTGNASPSPKGELPYTSRAKKVLEFALAAARDLRNDTISMEHLLLGLLREKKGIAAVVLEGAGVTSERVLQRLGATQPAKMPRFHVSLDDTASRSIYEQIIAQVTEAVATGMLQPGERMPTVRQLADELDIAPGTVARAYSELERQGLVVTEGVRGTRVADRVASPRESLNNLRITVAQVESIG